jgi:hypothetical protein
VSVLDRQCRDCKPCVKHGGDGVVWGPRMETWTDPESQSFKVVVTRCDRIRGELVEQTLWAYEGSRAMARYIVPSEYADLLLGTSNMGP